MNYPRSGLTAFLDALERELLAAPAEEVRSASRVTGRARNIACEEIRALMNAAMDARIEGSVAIAAVRHWRRTGSASWHLRELRPRPAAILTRALFLLGTAVATNRGIRFCNLIRNRLLWLVCWFVYSEDLEAAFPCRSSVSRKRPGKGGVSTRCSHSPSDARSYNVSHSTISRLKP